jgi:hypothetical protein
MKRRVVGGVVVPVPIPILVDSKVMKLKFETKFNGIMIGVSDECEIVTVLMGK